MMEIDESIEVWGKMGKRDGGNNLRPLIAKPLDRATLAIRLTLFVLAGMTTYTFLTLGSNGVNVAQATAETLSNFATMFLHPYSHHLTVWDAFYEVLITLGLAYLTTVLGGVLALFLGLMAAQNLAPKWLTNIIKSFVAVIRAVPTILWVLIFAVAAGLGSTAAVIGLTFHSVGYLTKAYSESFEDLDRSVIEALRATGANWWQVVFQAVIPSSATYLLSWTFLRFEINFGNAVAMGAAAGAAGIGFDLFMAGGYYFDLHEVGLITYLVLAFAIVMETAATYMKRRLQSGE
ncbi:phosphate-import permease protein PhnE [Peptococcaceae bacterium CEB3]|nr:phosphate-import permease protein PhnE [Peptococcaceae bacterium CEB3]